MLAVLLSAALSVCGEQLRFKAEQNDGITTYHISRGHLSLDSGIPTTNNVDVIYDHDTYAVGYSSRYKQPVWTIYHLTDRMFNHQGKFDRNEFVFRTNPLGRKETIRSTSADYTGSGYDRGHMVPAADMSWTLDGLEDTFYMSNICPQTPLCNRGVWKQLEQWTRDNAHMEKDLIVVSGPIFSTNGTEKVIGKSNVVVPEAFFKVIYDATPPVKTLGFIVPNEGCTNALDWYTVTVDEVEKRTGMTFFKDLPKSDQPDKKDFHPSLWNWAVIFINTNAFPRTIL